MSRSEWKSAEKIAWKFRSLSMTNRSGFSGTVVVVASSHSTSSFPNPEPRKPKPRIHAKTIWFQFRCAKRHRLVSCDKSKYVNRHSICTIFKSVETPFCRANELIPSLAETKTENKIVPRDGGSAFDFPRGRLDSARQLTHLQFWSRINSLRSPH